ncbi:MAG TPA: ABC transporter ATP-binding protein [Anaeromyxobacteraceae bacterium]|nr:ABC transporter ATP-binding protein [Anaeromyxobacteraceae bacterium]
MPDLAIRCRALVKRYPPDVLAVDGLDLEVRRGECFGLLGPNGAGKTTTVEILEGLLAPTAGEVEVLGRRWGRDAAALRQLIGLTLQETHLPERLTVEEVVRLFRSFYGRGRGVDEVIALVGLEEKRGAWSVKLSGGQRQRLAVATALVGDPELLFLDEPTTGLDPQSRRQLWDVVTDLKRQGKTVLLTTHYMDEAERLCDRVAIVDHGRVIALGTPRELVARHVGQEVVEFQAADGAPLLDGELSALPAVQSARRVAGGWALVTDQVHVVVPALLSRLAERGVPLAGLATHRATLEDVFVTLTGRRLRD